MFFLANFVQFKFSLIKDNTNYTVQMRQIYSSLCVGIVLLSSGIDVLYAQQNSKNLLQITTSSTNQVIPRATIHLLGKKEYSLTTDANGQLDFTQIPAGSYILELRHIGYKAFRQRLQLPLSQPLLIALNRLEIAIDEVYITAKESSNISRSSVINRKAMEHLQPSSFTDILELLPGGRAKDPSLMQVNGINLRAAGNPSSNYDINSLGTAFVMDGNAINNNANIQSVNGFSTSGNNERRNISNIGVDMRSLNTDNIEKIEIIRGIPSAEYGDLTSGVILIDRKKGFTPWSARLKSDGFSKLFSVEKGFTNLKRNFKINVDAGYLDAKSNPTDIYTNFKRVNASVRMEKTWQKERATYVYSNNLDYKTTIDGERIDPDNDFLLTDKYRSQNQEFRLANNLKVFFKKLDWLKSLDFTSNLSYSINRIEETRLFQAKSAEILTNSLLPGSHEASFIKPSYISNLTVDGQPFTAQTKALAKIVFNKTPLKHHIKVGVESNYSKNFGKGQQFDLDLPPTSSLTARPRAYDDIPGLHLLTAFAEDQLSIKAGKHRFEAMLGIRAFSLTSLDQRFDLANKVQVDPRANVRWELPTVQLAGSPLRLSLSGGYGIHTKTPTLSMLYPSLFYRDVTELSYYTADPATRLAWVNTSIYDPTNRQLSNSRNKKWEFGADVSYKSNQFSVNYFQENLQDGFRDMSHFETISFTKYNSNSVDPTNLTSKPSITDFTGEAQQQYYGYQRVENGSQVNKKGIEYTFSSARIRGINTRVTVNGAWYITKYNTSQAYYKSIPSNVITDGKILQYLGYYEDPDGNTYEQLNTNLTLDSYLPQWGLTFSSSIQSLWYFDTQRQYMSGSPVGYYDIEGQYFDYTEANKTDGILSNLTTKYGENIFDKYRTPIDLQVNFKVTKDIKQRIKASMFVNRLFTYTPSYERNDVTIRRRSAAPYFGMEISINF